MTPKVDVRIVIAVTITVISVIQVILYREDSLYLILAFLYVVQYIGWHHSYNTALNAALRMPMYRSKAKDIARERGLLDRKRKGVLKVSSLKSIPYTLYMYVPNLPSVLLSHITCVRVGHLGVWRELVNHKRYLTRPLSQFSRLGTQVSYSFCVCPYFTGVVCWVWVSFLSFLPLRIYT